MKQSDINKIYNMTITQRESFKKNYPTPESLADAIQEVFKSSTLEKIRKDQKKYTGVKAKKTVSKRRR